MRRLTAGHSEDHHSRSQPADGYARARRGAYPSGPRPGLQDRGTCRVPSSNFAIGYNDPQVSVVFSLYYAPPAARMIISDPVANPQYWIDCGIFNGPCTSLDPETLARAQPLVNPSVVPEPASMLLLGSGILGLLAKHRRRAAR